MSYCAMASAVGARVLRQGGNAMDAAVATSIALAVTFPQAGNLGGGGFLLYKPSNGPTAFLDYRETAPRAAEASHFVASGTRTRDERHATSGGRAVATPGTVAGLAEALARHGTWSWSRVVEPSIELARVGVWLTTRQARYLELYTDAFADFPSTAKIFLPGPGGQTLLPGDRFAQPDLAWTLERLALEGPRSFYEGELGARLVRTVTRHGGVLSMADLGAYEPVWREPLSRSFLGRTVVAPSLPSGGGIVLLACLGLFEAEGFGSTTAPGSVERLRAYGRVMRTAFRLRGALVGDPARLPPATQAKARAVAERSFAEGDLARLEASLDPDAPMRLGSEQNTTHLCVIDGAGNAVSNTYSLNTIFGAKLVVEGGGYFLNNSMDDFSLVDGAPNWYELSDGKENHLEPGKRPVSSMTPTIFLAPPTVPSPQSLELLLGGSGGPRIPTLVFQIAQAVLGDDLSLEEAVRQPRVHHQNAPDELAIEEAMRPAIKAALRQSEGSGTVPHQRVETVAETPVLGIAAALRLEVEAKASPGSGAGKLSAVLDSRFALV